MTKTILCAAVLTLTPSLAQAAVGTIIEHRNDNSVSAGVMRSGAGNVASYRNADGWWVYAHGARRLIDADANSVLGVWVVDGGAAFHLYDSGELWFTDMDDAGRRLVGPGDACPNGTAETILSVGLPFVIYDEAAHVQIRCGNTTDIYLATRDGVLTPLVYDDLPLTGFEESTSPPLLLATTGLEAFSVVSPGEVLFTGQSYGCAPDPLCGNFGTFRLRNGTAEALHISQAQTSGIHPSQRGEIMTHLRANDMGEVAFVLGSVFSPRVTIGVWRPDGTVREVISTGDPAVGTGASFAGFAVVAAGTDVDHFQIDDQGYVSFMAATTEGELALWHETGAGLQRLVWPGQELFDYPGSEVVSVDAVRTSKDGRLAAIVTNGAGTLPSQAVLAQDLQGEIHVAWHREEVIYDGAQELTIDGQAGFGDPRYETATHSNGMDGRGIAFADNGRLYIGIGGPNESAAVILELDADPGSGETGGGSETDYDTSGMPPNSGPTTTGILGSSDSSADSTATETESATSTGGSDANSGGGGCQIDRKGNRPIWGMAVVLLAGLIRRRSTAKT